MNVDRVGPPVVPSSNMSHPRANGRRAKDADDAPPVQPTDATPDGQDPDAVTTADAKSKDDSPRGVIRLLLAGHFKGVADVRLRINFHEELAAAGFQEAGPAVTTKAASLAESVSAKLDELRSSDTLTEEQLAELDELESAFNSAIDALVQDFLNGGDRDPDSLAGALQSAFDELSASLTSLLGLDAEPEPIEPSEELDEPPAVAPDDPAVEPGPEELEDAPPAEPIEDEPEPFDLQQFMDDLQELFSTSLDGLEADVAGTSFLPPLSSPQGNGGAYAKFLDMYNELIAPEDPPEEEPAQTVEVIA